MRNSDSDEKDGKHTLDFMKNRVCSYTQDRSSVLKRSALGVMRWLFSGQSGSDPLFQQNQPFTLQPPYNLLGPYTSWLFMLFLTVSIDVKSYECQM